VNPLSYVQAILLGIVQGVTEFLPISSSGHLALSQQILGIDAAADASIIFDLAVHLGTVVAVALVFGGDFARFFRRLAQEASGQYAQRRTAWRIAILAVVASLPTAAIGLFFSDVFERAFAMPRAIGIALIITGSLLWATGRIPRPRRGWRRFQWWQAFVIGVGQGLAIMPGISRSGTTIALALLLGIKRRWAGQFSFLIAVPAICGASALKFSEALSHGDLSAAGMINGPVIVGTIAAIASGYLALRVLLSFVQRARLHWFAYYCWLIGLVAIIAASHNG